MFPWLTSQPWSLFGLVFLKALLSRRTFKVFCELSTSENPFSLSDGPQLSCSLHQFVPNLCWSPGLFHAMKCWSVLSCRARSIPSGVLTSFFVTKSCTARHWREKSEYFLVRFFSSVNVSVLFCFTVCSTDIAPERNLPSYSTYYHHKRIKELKCVLSDTVRSWRGSGCVCWLREKRAGR